MLVIFIFVMCILEGVVSSPIVTTTPHSAKSRAGDSSDDYFDQKCSLSQELGKTGKPKFIEDCKTLSLFRRVPVPAPGNQQYGVHPVVCCPKNKDDQPICFPNNDHIFGCNEEFVDELLQDVPEKPSQSTFLLRDGAQFCEPGDTCTTISRCGLMNEVYPTDIGPCGFSEEESESLVCCPQDYILEIPQQKPKPRFLKKGKPHPCEDKTIHCKRWKSNGACLLNETFVPSTAEPGYTVSSFEMFPFMSETCMETCGRCGSRGCVDDHVKCPEWARAGQCYEGHGPFITALTCRESCGLCGFLSPFNTDIQVVQGKSYTKYKDTNFDCGRSENLTVLDEKYTRKQAEKSEFSENVENAVVEDFDLRESDKGNESDSDDYDDDLDEVSFANSSNATISCAATIISDRWMVTAAHCYDEIQGDGGTSIRIQTLRDTFNEISESIEVRNIYVYPEYEAGSLYNDITLLELGRRVLFDFQKFGDTPVCIDTGLELEGKLANLQGFGKTEFGTLGELLETNVTLINNNQCRDELTEYLKPKRRRRTRKTFCKYFPIGISDHHICANGIFNAERNVTSGACKGDSGGPVEYLQGEEKLRYLVGIVSGSLSCSGKAPEWFTRVAYFREWIDCITTAGPGHNFSKEEVEKVCTSTVRPAKQIKTPEVCNPEFLV